MPSSNVITLAELDTQYELPYDYSLEAGHSDNYIESLKAVNKLPFSKGTIYYSDDVWDFSQYSSLNVQKSKLKFRFSSVDESLRDDAKNYVLLKILANKDKLQSIQRNYSEVRKYFSFLTQKHIYNVTDITTSTLEEYLQSVENKNSLIALRFAKTVVKDFYIQYSLHFSDIITPTMLEIFKQDSFKKLRAHQEVNKSPLIPEEYFDRLLSGLLIILDDETMDIGIRGAAGVYVILSQTGLRISEVIGLSINALQTTTLFNGQETNYLEYKTWKREKGNNVASTESTYVNQLVKKAFQILSDLYAYKRKQFNMDYLYMGSSKHKERSFPIHSEQFRKQAYRLFTKMDELGLLKTLNLSDAEYPELTRKKMDDGNYISFPTTQQFRFHVCTELSKKGVPLKYIQKFMSHLTFDMTRYHIHPKKSPQEDMEYSLKVLCEVVSGKTTLLGDSKGLSERIQRFIQDNNYNVETDLDAICTALAEKIPIRQKTGGVCIKSSQLRDCSVDAKTNEFYCAYGVCPNIFHFYYMVDITYRQCKELVETININRARNHMRQVQKETNMLNTIAKTRLQAELSELKRMVLRDGVEQIYLEHPNLQDIIENLATVEEEAMTWTSLKS